MLDFPNNRSQRPGAAALCAIWLKTGNATKKKWALASGILALVSACIFLALPRKSGDERLYVALLQSQAALQRIYGPGGGTKSIDWVRAFSHFDLMDPEQHYQRTYEAAKQSLVASGYLVTLKVRSTNLTQVFRLLSGPERPPVAWYESAVNPERGEASILCPKNDVQLWKQTLTTLKEQLTIEESP
jgi:hypothetical protein